MKKTKIARRLILSKQTVAHLNDEQMSGARGGAVTDTCFTCETCSKTGYDSKLICTQGANGVTENCS
jgi:hypothetical protein